MEKIRNNKILYFFAQVVYNTIFAMIVWPLIDIIFDKNKFIYSVNDHIIQPIMYGFFIVIFTNILKSISNKKENKK